MTPQLSCPELNTFLEGRQRKILAIAQRESQRTAQEVVEKEIALMDFELLMSVNLPKKEELKLTTQCKKLRKDSWKEIEERFNGDYKKSMEFIDNF